MPRSERVFSREGEGKLANLGMKAEVTYISGYWRVKLAVSGLAEAQRTGDTIEQALDAAIQQFTELVQKRLEVRKTELTNFKGMLDFFALDSSPSPISDEVDDELVEIEKISKELERVRQ